MYSSRNNWHSFSINLCGINICPITKCNKMAEEEQEKKAKRLQTLSKTLDESNGFKVSKADFMIFGIEIICPL